MRARGDRLCLHQPFGETWYQGEDRRCPPQRSGGPTSGLTFASVWDDLRASTSLEAPAHQYLPVDTNEHPRESYEYCLPHYQVMYRHRLGN